MYTFKYIYKIKIEIKTKTCSGDCTTDLIKLLVFLYKLYLTPKWTQLNSGVA